MWIIRVSKQLGSYTVELGSQLLGFLFHPFQALMCHADPKSSLLQIRGVTLEQLGSQTHMLTSGISV